MRVCIRMVCDLEIDDKFLSIFDKEVQDNPNHPLHEELRNVVNNEANHLERHNTERFVEGVYTDFDCEYELANYEE